MDEIKSEKDQVDAYLKLRGARQNERDRLMALLLDDVNDAAALMIEKNNHQTERGFVLAAAMALEGIQTALRQEILEDIRMNATKVPFTLGEVILLQGRHYGIDDKGEPTRSAAKLRFRNHVLFTLRCLEKAYGLKDKSLRDDATKGVITTLVKIRDRLVHPKSTSDLTISKPDIDAIRTCVNWLHSLLDRKFKAFNEHWKSMANTLHIPGTRELTFFEISEDLTDANSI